MKKRIVREVGYLQRF